MFFKCSFNLGVSLVAQLVKNLPTMTETRVRFLGREDLLEKQMATHSSIPARIIPGTEEPEGLQSMGSRELGHDLATKLSPFNLRAVQLLQTSPKVVRLENSNVIKKNCSPYPPKNKAGIVLFQSLLRCQYVTNCPPGSTLRVSDPQ